MVCMTGMLAENMLVSLCRYGTGSVGPVFMLCQDTLSDHLRPHQDSMLQHT